MWYGLFIALLATGTKAFAPAPIRWGGLSSNKFIVASHPNSLRNKDTASLLLTIGDPPGRISPNVIPYFAAQSDNTITWDTIGMRMCMEASGFTSGHKVRINRCKEGANQRWKWLPWGPIQLKGTNQCLDVAFGKVGLDGAPIELRECDGEKASEFWKFEHPITQSMENHSIAARHAMAILASMVAFGTLSVGAWLRLSRKNAHTEAMIGEGDDGGGIRLTAPSAAWEGTTCRPLAAVAAHCAPRSLTMSAVDRDVLTVEWCATDGTMSDKFIGFNEKHYIAMLTDERRTSLYVEAIEKALAKHPPHTQTVLEIGPGPFAVLAKAAARAGAKKVYAIEANADVAARARQEVEWAHVIIPPGTVEVIEGFSTEVELPEKVDLLVSEIAGSVVSQEGVYATIKNAQRFMKQPFNASSYIPYSYQTLGAPAIDAGHHSGAAEDRCLRAADDPTLQLLAEPRLIEDIRCSDPFLPASGAIGAVSPLVWEVDPARVSANEKAFRERLRSSEASIKANGLDFDSVIQDVSHSLSGVALWPRIVLDEAATMVYDSRGRKERKTSHWETYLPLLDSRPVGIEPNDVVHARFTADLQDGKVTTPLRYRMSVAVYASKI